MQESEWDLGMQGAPPACPMHTSCSWRSCSLLRSFGPPPAPPSLCRHAGLTSETGELAALQEELGRIQVEQGRLPKLVAEVSDALEAEAAAFARQEAGTRYSCALLLQTRAPRREACFTSRPQRQTLATYPRRTCPSAPSPTRALPLC